MSKRQSVFVSVVLALFISIGGFISGVLIGGNNDFTWLCLPNGCGYEATGTIGFFAGLIIGAGLVVWSIMRKNKE